MGRGTENFIVVFKVGLAPGLVGIVLIFETAGPPGGIKLFTLKVMNAFLTGRIPGDYSSLKPRMSKSTLNSFVSTKELNAVSCGPAQNA